MMLALALMLTPIRCSAVQSPITATCGGLLHLYKRLVYILFSVEGRIGLTYSDNGPSILRFYNFRIHTIVESSSSEGA